MFDDDLGRSGLLIQPRIFLAVAADRIARVFNMPFSDEAITFDISITFNKIWHAGLLWKLTSNGIPDRFFQPYFFIYQ